jgi:stress response protein YsnF
MTDEEVEVIPIIEERLKTSKVTVETGRVRVRTVVDERQEIVRDQLMRDRVEVQRIPRNIEISEAPVVREEGDVTIIPVVEEVLVVQKKLMLVEEIHLHRSRSHEEFEQPVTVRVQRAVVERERDSGEEMPTQAGEYQ